MKQLCTFLMLILSFFQINAQLPDNSISPDFNMFDINGQQHHVYSYLTQGKTVILNFSAASCQPCYNYHQSGALREFYALYGPGGTDDIRVLHIETDSTLGLLDLEGRTTASAGDWVTGATYPIIDSSAANLDFMPDENPTIYGIYPDGRLHVLDNPTPDDLFDFWQAYEGDVLLVDTMIKVDIVEERPPSCNGFDDGAISLAVDGPGTSYDFEWNNGDSTTSITQLREGTFRCTITDNLGNLQVIDPILLQDPDSLDITFIINTPTSQTSENGSVIASASGGTEPYNYLWNTGVNSALLPDIGEGTYSVQLFDANGCQYVDSVTVVVPICGLVLAISAEPTSCDENPDGEIALTVAGATAPVTYTWSNGDSTRNINNLSSGVYQVTVTDAMGCTSMAGAEIEIDDDVPPVARVRGPLTLYLDQSGMASLSPEAVDSNSFDNCGILDIQLEKTTFGCSDLGRKFIEFTVIDQNLNITSRDIDVTILDTLSPFWQCPDSIVVPACNGIVNYERPVIIDNCPTGSITTFTGIGPGNEFPLGTSTETYTYVAGNGFRTTCSFDVTVVEKISADLNVRDVRCAGQNNGSATATVIDGSGSYSYVWSNGQRTQTAVNLSPGNYSVTISDTTECTFVEEFFIGEPIELSVRVDDITASNGNAGIYITALGGIAPIDYTWKDENGNVISTTEDLLNVEYGTYTLELTDANGCAIEPQVIQADETTPTTEVNPLEALTLGPNPSQGIIRIDFAGNRGESEIQFLNPLGRIVLQRSITVSDEATIDARGLPSGMYTVRIQVGKHQTLRKLSIL